MTPTPDATTSRGAYVLGILAFNAGNWVAPSAPHAPHIREDWVRGWVATWNETMDAIDEAGDLHAGAVMSQYLRWMHRSLGDDKHLVGAGL